MRRVVLSHCTIDLVTGSVKGSGVDETLTELERRLVEHLRQAQGEAVDRDTLLRKVWGHHEPGLTRAVDLAVRRLRRKLEPDAGHPTHLLTVHSVGYRLVGAEPARARPSRAHMGPLHGREAELAELMALLDGPRPLVVVVGAPGSGKSRLVREALGEQGATWLHGPTFPSGAALSLPDDVDQIVIDDADELGSELPGLLQSHLSAHPAQRIVVTAQRPTGVPGERLLVLEPLGQGPATDLLREQLTALGCHVEDLDLREVVEAVDRLPGALCEVSTRARHATPATLPDLLGQATHTASVQAALDRLPLATLTTAQQLACVLGGADAELAEALGLDSGGLAELRDRSLVRALPTTLPSPPGTPRSVALPAPRLRMLHATRRLLTSTPAHRARHAEAVRIVAQRHRDAWERTGKVAHATTLVALQPDLHSALTWARAHAPARVLDLAELLTTDLDSRVPPVLTPPWRTQALTEARTEARIATVVRLLCAEGRAHRLRSTVGQAHALLEEAASMASAHELGPESAEAQLHLGRILLDLGQMEAAATTLDAARSTWRALGWPAAAARAQVWLGEARLRQARRVDAEALLIEASALLEVHGAERALGTAAVLRARLAHLTHDLPRARTLLQQGLQQLQAAGNLRGEAVAWSKLADLLADLGELEDALQAAEHALRLHRDAQAHRSEGVVLGNLAALHLELDDLVHARRCAVQALALHQRVGNPRFTALAQLSLGLIDQQVGRTEAAREHLATADASLRAGGLLPLAAAARAHLTILELREGSVGIDDARETLQECQAEAKNQPAVAASLALLEAVVDVESGDLDAARARLAAAEAPARKHAEVRLVRRYVERALASATAAR